MDEPDCRTCGACCLPEYSAAHYVTLSARDIQRLTPRYRLRVSSCRSLEGGSLETKVTTPTVGPLAGREVCSCVALRGSVGHRVSCSIYDRRPSLCRSFAPGSAECRDARRILE